ncbi:MAG: CpXC domain-containing protein, partial [Anaerolineaceae bacterium]
MAQSLTHIQCPNCKSGIQAALEQLVDVGQDPSAKSRLLSGTFNRISCPVCGFEGQMSTPLVYHDPTNELLLTYVPVELNIPKEEQERVIGQLINQAVQDLPAEMRKGYLFQPQPVLTMQSLMERILEADGISREDIEAQRAKMRLFEDLVRTPEEHLTAFIKDHDDEMDATFFQLASLTLQATSDPKAYEALNQRLGVALEHTSYGKELSDQEAELRAAAESLKEAGEELDRKGILDLLIQAPNDRRIMALVNLTRPALDYSFFQELTSR